MSLSKSSDTLVGSGPVVLPRVNLLPPEIGERKQFRRVQAGLAGSVVVAVGVVAALYVGASGAVTDAQSQVDSASAQHSALASETAKYRDVTATYRRTADAQAMLVAAMGEEVRYSRFFNDLAVSVPTGVWVKNAVYAQGAAAATGATGATAAATAATAAATGSSVGSLTLSGVAFEHDQVADWLDLLAEENGYGTPALQSSAAGLLGSKPVVTWSATVPLTADALSGRYAKTGS